MRRWFIFIHLLAASSLRRPPSKSGTAAITTMALKRSRTVHVKNVIISFGFESILRRRSESVAPMALLDVLRC